MKIKMYSKDNIGLVPSYICNTFCKFCYAKNLQKDFPAEMSWSLFKEVIQKCQKEGKNEISFFGGEPTLWRYIDEAVYYLQNKKIQVNFFTNGLKHSKIAPDCALININNIFAEKNRRAIEKSILFYKENNVEIGVRYNLVHDTPRKKDEVILKWVGFLADKIDYVSISPAVPYPFTREFGERIFNLAFKICENSQKVKISRAIPICLFDREQFGFLRKNCGLQTECYSPKNIIINPDGKTAFPCVNITMFTRSLLRNNLKKIEEDYELFFKKLKGVGRPSQCRQCEYGRDMRCQAGCLGMRNKQAMRLLIAEIK